MKKISLAVALLVSIPAFAAPAHTGAVETCLKAVLAKHPGDIISLEAEIEKCCADTANYIFFITSH